MNNCLFCGGEVKNMYCGTSCQLKHEYAIGVRCPQKITSKAHQTLREKGHYKRDNSYLKKKDHITPEGRRANSLSKMGGKNPMYGQKPWNYQDDGHLKEKYIKRKDWLKIKKLILIRDGFECQGCGINSIQSQTLYNGQSLQVHHLIPYRICREHKTDNLITLCCSCHSKATQIEQKANCRSFIRFIRETE